MSYGAQQHAPLWSHKPSASGVFPMWWAALPFCLAEPTTGANLWVGQYLAWLALMLSVAWPLWACWWVKQAPSSNRLEEDSKMLPVSSGVCMVECDRKNGCCQHLSPWARWGGRSQLPLTSPGGSLRLACVSGLGYFQNAASVLELGESTFVCALMNGVLVSYTL